MKKLKKSNGILILLVCLYLTTILGGCSMKFKSVSMPKVKIGILAQNFNDKSFGQIAKKGLEEAKDKYKIEPQYEEFKTDTKGNEEEITKALRKLAEKSKMVIAMGEETKSSVEKVARERRDKMFTVVDAEVEESNVKSILFKHEEGSFLMGIVAGNETKSNKVGYVGGVNDKMGLQFSNGYTAGVKTVNKEAAKNLIDGSNIRFIQSYSDEQKAYDRAIELYDLGCDIIFQACGKAGMGVFKAAKEKGKLVIGIDVDQKKEFPEYKDQIISSMIKSVDKVVLNACKEIQEGSFKSGIDNIEEYGIKQKTLDYAPSTQESVSKKTMDDLNKYKKMIEVESIKIPKTLYEVIEFQA